VREVYADDPEHLTEDRTRQDSIVLNLQRACEACTDLAMHRVRRRGLGVPQDSRGAFDLPMDAGRLDAALADALEAMVGCPNVAVRDYMQLDLAIVRAIVERHTSDLLDFASASLRAED
jgi:uncharacterized protein YutE (UPF0331/DUF86 family)